MSLGRRDRPAGRPTSAETLDSDPFDAAGVCASLPIKSSRLRLAGSFFRAAKLTPRLGDLWRGILLLGSWEERGGRDDSLMFVSPVVGRLSQAAPRGSSFGQSRARWVVTEREMKRVFRLGILALVFAGAWLPYGAAIEADAERRAVTSF